MPGPEREMTGDGGRGRLRASHADRERVIDMLKAAYVRGHMTKDEFDVRVGQALVSRTYAELARVTAGIPAMPATPPSARLAPATDDAAAQACIRSAHRAVVTAAVFACIALMTIIFATSALAWVLVAGCVFTTLSLTATQMLSSQQDK
jgi:uncharacterized protein DUF1707